MLNLITRSMTRRGKLGADAVRKVIEKKDGSRITVKVNPDIKVTGCLPDEIPTEEQTVENALSLFSNDAARLWAYIVWGYDKYRLAQTQAELSGEPVESVFTAFYAENPDWAAKKFAGLTGDDLSKAKTAFAKSVSQMANNNKIDVADVLKFVLMSAK